VIDPPRFIVVRLAVQAVVFFFKAGLGNRPDLRAILQSTLSAINLRKFA